MRQLQVLDDLIDLVPKWHGFLNKLEGEISKSAIANTRSFILTLPLEKTTLFRLLETGTTLQFPHFAKRQGSLSGINSCQYPSRSKLLIVLEN